MGGRLQVFPVVPTHPWKTTISAILIPLQYPKTIEASQHHNQVWWIWSISRGRSPASGFPGYPQRCHQTWLGNPHEMRFIAGKIIYKWELSSKPHLRRRVYWWQSPDNAGQWPFMSWLDLLSDGLIITWLAVSTLPLWKMMEFVNGKDDIPYMKWKRKFMFQTTNQLLSVPISSNLDSPWLWLWVKILPWSPERTSRHQPCPVVFWQWLDRFTYIDHTQSLISQ